MRLIAIFFLGAIAAVSASPADAQMMARVVSSCGGASPAGSNFVGSLVAPTVDTNGLLCSSATSSGSLGAGTAIIGKVGVDQTTPGTTNGVVVNSSGDTTASGSITTQNLTSTVAATPNSAVTITTTGLSTLNIQVTGTYTGALSLQGTVDGTNWITLSSGAIFYNKNSGADSTTIASAGTGIFASQAAGYAQMRVTGLAAMTGTAVVTIVGSQAYGPTVGTVQGTIANGGVAQGNPVLIGGSVVATAAVGIGAANVLNLSLSPGRQLITVPYAPSDTTWQHAAASGGIVNSTTAETLAAAGAANVRNYLVGLQVCVAGTAANVVSSEIAIRDGAAGTVIWRGSTSLGVLGCDNYVMNPPLKGTAATLMEAVTLTAVGASTAVYVNAQGFQGS